jgi:hypothetical protein
LAAGRRPVAETAPTSNVVNRVAVGWVKAGVRAARTDPASGGRITAAVLGRASWSFSNPMLPPKAAF